MSRRISLDQLSVASPCTKDWDEMDRAGEAKRFCDHCQKNVHDLSLMTLSDAEKLICESAGAGICVRMSKDAAGKLITLDYQAPPPASRWRRWRPVTFASGLAAAICGFVFATFTIGRPNPVFGEKVGKISIRGAIAPAVVGDVAPPVLGEIGPSTQPATQPSTQPVKMGLIALPTTQPE